MSEHNRTRTEPSSVVWENLVMNVNYNSPRRQLFLPTCLFGRLLDLRRSISC
jgi:hypothetical protein